jgi:hypothetical protein
MQMVRLNRVPFVLDETRFEFSLHQWGLRLLKAASEFEH